MYRVEYKQKAIKSIQRLDKPIARLIIAWIEKNLINCQNPRLNGKALSGDFAGSWRYRVGDYRIIAHIDDRARILLILDINHRGRIYV